MFLGISLKIIKILSAKISMQLIDQPVFVWFLFSRITIKLIDNYFKSRNKLTRDFAQRKKKILQLAECIV